MIKNNTFFNLFFWGIIFLNCSLFSSEFEMPLLIGALSARIKDTADQAAGLEKGLRWMGAGFDVCAMTGGGSLGLFAAHKLELDFPSQTVLSAIGAASAVTASQGVQLYVRRLGKSVREVAKDQQAIAAHMDSRFAILESNLKNLAEGQVQIRQDVQQQFCKLREDLNLQNPDQEVIKSVEIEQGINFKIPAVVTSAQSQLHTYGPGFLAGVSVAGVAMLVVIKSGVLDPS